MSGVAQTRFTPPQELGHVLQSHPRVLPRPRVAAGTGTPPPAHARALGVQRARLGGGRQGKGGPGSTLGTGRIGEQSEILGLLLVLGAGDPWGCGMERWGRGTGWGGRGTG